MRHIGSMITRRHTLLGMAAGGTIPLISACSDANRTVTHLVRPGQARVVWPVRDAPVIETGGTFDGRRFTTNSPFRVASISKVMVAELARRLHIQGALDLDADVADGLNFNLRHPDFPGAAITLRRLISHQSGIIDPAVYWVRAPGNIRSILTDDIYEPGVEPGQGFRYANLNYGLAATVMEAATGRRFDHLFTELVARPLDLDIGFNWSGVSAEKRRSGFPCMRWMDETWQVQIDGPETLEQTDPAILKEPGWSLSDYEPGTNGTLFSPQGGLRASVRDLILIGQKVLMTQPELATPIWRAGSVNDPASQSETTNGQPSEGGHFLAFGDGVYIYEDHPPFPANTYGHFGEAYGFYGGLWLNPATQTVFVHANLGSPAEGFPMTGDIPNLTTSASSDLAWARENGF